MKYQDNDFDEIDEMLFKYFKENKEVPQKTQNIIKNMNYNGKRNNFGIRKIAITILAITTLTTGGVFAKDIVSFFKNIFSLSSININNDSVVDAIEKDNYIQNVNSKFIKINNDYKIKIDYLMLDDINLYIVFDLQSKNEMQESYRMSIIDLMVRNENDEIIYSANDENTINNLNTIEGSKKIETTNNNERKELTFITSNGYPKMEKIKISFNTIVLYNEENYSEDKIQLNCNAEFKINLEEKFINRKTYNYLNYENIENGKIEKCISSNTGTYVIMELGNSEQEIDLIYDNKIYKGKKRLLGVYNNGKYELLYQFNITTDDINKDTGFSLIMEKADNVKEYIKIK